MQAPPKTSDNERSEFIDALRKGVLLGAAILVLVLPPMWRAKQPEPAAPPPSVIAQNAPAKEAVRAPAAGAARPDNDAEIEAELAAGGSRGGTLETVAEAEVDPSGYVEVAAKKKSTAKDKGAAQKDKGTAKKGKSKADAKAAAKESTKPGPLADFGKVEAPEDVVHVANWVSYTRDNKKKSFVLIDKKMARLYVFDPQGKLKSSTPILLGKAIGDHTVPGVGNKPLSQVKEDEKTTPAGRFVAEPGKNTHGEDIIWIDYEAAVSMHRFRKVSAAERRAERLATPDEKDNRISFGCVNVPPKFYNSVLKPSVFKHGAIVYVLPETKTPQQLFASYDVTKGKDKDKGVQVAEAATTKAGK